MKLLVEMKKQLRKYKKMGVKQFPFGGVGPSIMKKYLIKEYRCGKCKNTDITILINEGGVKTYQCNKCKRLACNPRIYYKLKKEYRNEEAIKKIVNELGISFYEHILYRGKLAVLVAIFKNFLEGNEAISRNITRLEVKGRK